MDGQAARRKKGVHVTFDPKEVALEETDANLGGEDDVAVHLSIRGSLTNLALQAKDSKVYKTRGFH